MRLQTTSYSLSRSGMKSNRALCQMSEARRSSKSRSRCFFGTEFALGRHLAEVGHEAGFVLEGELIGVHRAGVEVHHVRGRFRMGGVKVRRHLHQSKPPFSTPQ